MTRKCALPTCQRAPAPTYNGTLHALCLDHERAALSGAYHVEARAGVLRPSIVGGIPIDQDPVLGDEDTGAVPFAS